ncbi:GTP pyrophosphokinase family protein [Galactobacter caseinivorans]|uniref:GTP pyrophosphokinase family protein n=2 Tax=Galactobacter caseinivorans TaxID=2676123 RepID=A0A496PIV3_9MICC|nr:GTP pyrophosphokinase family protein [Galactobacter caseinivorans]
MQEGQSAESLGRDIQAAVGKLASGKLGAGQLSPGALGAVDGEQLRELRAQMQRFMLEYQFGLREVETKLAILRDEFLHMHAYNPIEHVSTRVKTPESIVEKIGRREVLPDMDAIKEQITDIAGARVTCSFTKDVYRLFDLLTRQDDITVLKVKDYIAKPKPSGYKSLHAVVQVPVFLSTGPVPVTVEIQFRTIAMDFWASLEHKIYYKFASNVPEKIVSELTEAAEIASQLDSRMERLHRELHGEVG